jgi:hypothetical protein
MAWQLSRKGRPAGPNSPLAQAVNRGRDASKASAQARAPAFSRNVRFVLGDVAVMRRCLGCMLSSVAVIDVVVRRSWCKSPQRRGSSVTGPSCGCWMRTPSSRRSVRSRRLPTVTPPRGSRRSPGTTPIVCSPRPTSSGSGAGSGPWCRSSSGSREGICTRLCSGFVMVPSGLLEPLHLPRCWSRCTCRAAGAVGQPSPRWHPSVVSAGVGDLAAAVQPPTTHRRARR